MNNAKLDVLIRSLSDQVQGELGYWQFALDDQQVLCVTDEHHDRMRVMVPIAKTVDLNANLLMAAMEANFDRSLDPRYCINNDTIWSAFIHPLRDLSDSLFVSACHQVTEAAKNFGTTFSSGGLSFNTDVI